MISRNRKRDGAKIYISLLLPIFILVFYAIGNAQQFTIEDFHAEIIINEDASIDVTETIEVEFDRQKHGIYREIPYLYEDELGDELIMPISVKSVTDENGEDWEYKVSKESNFVNIRIGDANIYVDGRQIYIISYQVENSILFFEDHDELYWNVTGDLWRAPIIKTSVTVILNTDKPNSKLIGACYTGRKGSSKSECSFETGDKKAQFTTNQSLNVNEGFTIALGWDKGIVTPPSDWQLFLLSANIRENWVFSIPLIIFVFMFFHWYSKGRDPRVREAVTVMYDPPQYNNTPLTPAQVGALVDERLDQRDITSSMINLGVKGFVEIREITGEKIMFITPKTDFSLEKLKEPDDKLSEFEQTLMKLLFPNSTNSMIISELKNKFFINLPKLHKIMFDELVKKNYFSTNPTKVKGKYGLIGMAVLLGGMFILYSLSPGAPWKGLVSGFLSGVAIIAFANAMPAKTKSGALTKMEILGFREFMNRADKDRIKRMGPNLFYKYLPYAIALDVTDNWIDAFSEMLTEPPSWYVGHYGTTAFSASRFSQSLTAATSHIGSTVFSTPRGSGTSGRGGSSGGSSGGGGGGGGGGSW